MIDSGVQAELVEDRDSGLFRLLVQGLHLLAQIAGCDHVHFVLDAHLGDQGMVDVRKETDHALVGLD